MRLQGGAWVLWGLRVGMQDPVASFGAGSWTLLSLLWMGGRIWPAPGKPVHFVSPSDAPSAAGTPSAGDWGKRPLWGLTASDIPLAGQILPRSSVWGVFFP